MTAGLVARRQLLSPPHPGPAQNVGPGIFLSARFLSEPRLSFTHPNAAHPDAPVLQYNRSMRKNHKACVLFLAAALLAQVAPAQTPLQSPRFMVPPNDDTLLLSGIAVDGAGTLTATWTNYVGSSFSTPKAYGRRFSSGNAALGAPFLLDAPQFNGFAGPVAANQRGDVLMTWSRSVPAGAASAAFVRRTSPVLPALTLQFPNIGDVAIDHNGNFVVLWGVSTPAGFRVHGQRYNAIGTRRGPEFDVATSTTGNHGRPSVAMNPETGEFVAVWEVQEDDGTVRGIYGQRFGFLTGRQGGEFPVYAPPADQRPTSPEFFGPRVARASDGGFVVVWKTALPTIDIVAQRYDAAGQPAGARLLIASNADISDGGAQIAMSRRGDFVVSWDDNGTSPLWFRLFHRDGRPAGPVMTPPSVGFTYLGDGRLAYGYNGTFALGWTNFADDGTVSWNLSYQRYSAASSPR